MTPKQHQVYQFIQQYMDNHAYAPTEAEIADAIGIKSRGVVHRYVSALAVMGKVEIIPGKRRNIRLPAAAQNSDDFSMPVLGRIAAGSPIEAVADDTVYDIGSQIMGRKRYLLQVRGESMINEGIFDGDYVVCEKSDTASNGQIVVALVDNQEATLKRFYNNEDGTVSLFPANAAYSPMVLCADRVRVVALYRGLFRFN